MWAASSTSSWSDLGLEATKSLLQKMANDTDGALVLTMWQARAAAEPASSSSKRRNGMIEAVVLQQEKGHERQQ